MIDVENINVIIGPGCVTGLRAIAPIAEQENVLLFSTGLLDDEIFKEYTNVINLATQISTEANYVATYVNSQKVDNIAVVHGTNYFGQEYGRRLPEALDREGLEVTSVYPTDLDETDFRTVILKIIQENPEAVFIHQGELQIGIFAKQLRELDYDIPIYGMYGTEAQSVLNSGGRALEGMEYTYPVNNAEGSEEKRTFEQRYYEKYKKTPSATSFFAYDGLILLDQAFEVCRFDDTQCIDKFFKTHGNYEGLSGLMKFEKDGSLTRPFGIKKIENGSFVWVVKEL